MKNRTMISIACVAALLAATPFASAEKIALNDFSAWRTPTGNWMITGDAVLNPQNDARLSPKAGSGVMLNGPTGSTNNIVTKNEWGDVSLHIEFVVPKGSNSGVYLMGRYEIQVFDSWGVADPQHSDCGGIYQRWRNDRGFEGRSPRVNASKAPGQWQSFDAIFRAPKFDAAGNKIANARFVEVKHNGVLVHQNVELTGPTRAATWENNEKATGPLMLQGDHGPVAYRNIVITPLDPESKPTYPLKALIVDGQNNHNWKGTTPVLKQLLEETGLFTVDVATTPADRQPMAGFAPDFAKYDVVVSNYTGDEWPAATKSAFEEYMDNGGGLVVYHAADNAFPNWPAWNEMIALGGWGGRNEKSGPMVRFRDGQMVLDNRPGAGGSHGPQHAFQLITRNNEHPITRGLPEKWMHAKDELYSTLRGPAKYMTLLATAYAAPEQRGTGEHEPMLFTINRNGGRIFHTALGHDIEQLKSVGFIVTFLRGAEWAATGMVTQTEVPDDFPTAEEVRLRTANNAKLPAGYGKEIVAWDLDKDRKALTAIEDDIRTAGPTRLLQIEAAIVRAMTNAQCTWAGKQWVCRMLRQMGTAQSVPALAAMLTDEKVSHMARYALERMPAPEAGAALIAALDRVEGDLKIGIVSSLGLRGEEAAADKIAPLMKSENRMMARAAITALSHFSNRTTGMALVETELPADLEDLRNDAILTCTDTMLSKGRTDFAIGIYQRMTAQTYPVFIRLAAYRGLVRAQQEQAVPTVVSLLRDENEDLRLAAAKFIAEMPGEAATKALAAQLPSLPGATQVVLIGALEDRADKAAAEAVGQAAASTDETVAVTAIKALATLGDASNVQLLAETSVKSGPIGKAAKDSLEGLGGDDVNKALVGVLDASDKGNVRVNVVDVLIARRAGEAVGALLVAAADGDVSVRQAAYKALGSLGGRDELPTLVEMLLSADLSERAAVERAVNAMAPRLNAADADTVIKAINRADADAKARLLGVLPKFGGDEALNAVRFHVIRSSGDVKKAGIRAMAEWSDPSPLKDLLIVATNQSDESMHVIALRGYIKLCSQPANRAASETTELLAKALPVARRVDEKKAILGALTRYPCKESLQLAESCLADAALRQEAELAAAKIKESLINKSLSATASREPNTTGNALDGNTGTRWTTGRPMKPGDWFTLDLGAEAAVKKITLDTRNSGNDYPRGYEVYVSFDGGEWGKPLLVGEGNNPITELAFEKPVHTRYVKIVQTGSSDAWHWSIHTLKIEFE
ncbi:MAG: ThuA domain-containing protein [Phycisphaerae bacterium]|nr:ThuA domain-containing protein [Phycisphaerae bacterium]